MTLWWTNAEGVVVVELKAKEGRLKKQRRGQWKGQRGKVTSPQSVSSYHHPAHGLLLQPPCLAAGSSHTHCFSNTPSSSYLFCLPIWKCLFPERHIPHPPRSFGSLLNVPFLERPSLTSLSEIAPHCHHYASSLSSLTCFIFLLST